MQRQHLDIRGNYFYRAGTDKQSSVICPHDLLIPVGDVPTQGGWFVVDGRTFKEYADGVLEFQEALRVHCPALCGRGEETRPRFFCFWI